jgi:hypothetical protein
MSLIYSLKKNKQGVTHVIGDYLGEMRPFAKRVEESTLSSSNGFTQDN